jgi:glutamyl-tRNA reductase
VPSAILQLLQEYVEKIRRGELERTCRRLRLSSEEKDAIDALSHSIVSKLMHTPVTVLKAVSADPTSADFVDAVDRLFNLACANPAPEH